MPRYYFHFSEDRRRTADPDGIVFDSHLEAGREACATLGAIAREAISEDRDVYDSVVEVVDSSGSSVMRATVAYRRYTGEAPADDFLPRQRLVRRLAEAGERIARQKEVVARLAAAHLPYELAQHLLDQFERAAALYQARLERLH